MFILQVIQSFTHIFLKHCIIFSCKELVLMSFPSSKLITSILIPYTDPLYTILLCILLIVLSLFIQVLCVIQLRRLILLKLILWEDFFSSRLWLYFKAYFKAFYKHRNPYLNATELNLYQLAHKIRNLRKSK